MPFSQIDDILLFDNQVVKGRGPLWRPQDLNLASGSRIPDEEIKTFWVRVCQTEHVHGPAAPTGISANIAEGEVSGAAIQGTGSWAFDLPILQGHFEEGDATVTAALVFEAGGDLFTLTWAECVHLQRI
jgi:hypothetical protein